MRTLFTVTAGLTALLGVGWTFFPHAMFGMWAVQTDEVGVYMARRYGCLLFGYVVLLWLARTAPASPARSAILVGGAVVTTAMTLVSLYGVLTRLVGPGAWGAVGIEALLAAAFIHHCGKESQGSRVGSSHSSSRSSTEP
jgi:hypothetical protein